MTNIKRLDIALLNGPQGMTTEYRTAVKNAMAVALAGYQVAEPAIC